MESTRSCTDEDSSLIQHRRRLASRIPFNAVLLEAHILEVPSDHISNWTCYVYNLASNSLDHVSNWKCVVLKSGHNFGQMSFFSGTLIRTDVAFGQMSLSDRSRVTVSRLSASSLKEWSGTTSVSFISVRSMLNQTNSSNEYTTRVVEVCNCTEQKLVFIKAQLFILLMECRLTGQIKAQLFILLGESTV